MGANPAPARPVARRTGWAWANSMARAAASSEASSSRRWVSRMTGVAQRMTSPTAGTAAAKARPSRQSTASTPTAMVAGVAMAAIRSGHSRETTLAAEGALCATTRAMRPGARPTYQPSGSRPRWSPRSCCRSRIIRLAVG